MSGVSSSPSPPILSSSSSSSSKAEYLPLTIINTTNQRSHTPHTPHSDAFASSSSSSQPPVRAADRPDTSLSRSPSRHSQTRHSPSLSIQTQHLVADQDDTSNSFKMGREYYTEDDASKPLKGDVSPISYSSIEDEASSELSITELARKPNESLYIKKCALVNQEIDRMGMGKYQWHIWSLCGLGYLLDLLIAQGFGLILGPIEQEFGFSSNQSGAISVSFSIGMTIGALFWGILVDIVGRAWAYNCTVLISAVFGTLLGTSNSYETFLVYTACVGFGVGGNIPIDTTICLEFIPQSKRRLLPLLSIFQPIGVVMCTGLAYKLIPRYSCSPNFSEAVPLQSCNAVPFGEACCGRDKFGNANNMGWRYLLYCVGGITIAAWLLRTVAFRFRESPKFLLYKGRDDAAVEVLQQISKFNGRDCTVSLEDFEKLTMQYEEIHGTTAVLGGGAGQEKATFAQKANMELSRYKLLFSSWPVAWLTILVWCTYAADYFGFTVAGTYLPTVIAKKNADIHLSLEDTYASYPLIYLPGVAGVALGVMCYDLPRAGRKLTMVFSSFAMGASLFLFATINSQAANIGVNAMEYFFQSMFNAVLYGFTPEAFDAPIRGTACGLSSFWGRFAGIVAPLIAQRFLPSSPHAPASAYDSVLYLAGAVTLCCVVFTALLPSKMVGSKSN